MNPDRRVHEGILLGKVNPGIQDGRAIAVANRNHRPHPGLAGAGNDLLAVRVELLAVKMCVRVYKHIVCPEFVWTACAGTARMGTAYMDQFMWGRAPSPVRPSERSARF